MRCEDDGLEPLPGHIWAMRCEDDDLEPLPKPVTPSESSPHVSEPDGSVLRGGPRAGPASQLARARRANLGGTGLRVGQAGAVPSRRSRSNDRRSSTATPALFRLNVAKIIPHRTFTGTCQTADSD